ncbi:MAG TPA: carboxylate-amine ligase, partial [Rhodobacteraceae bacterium]|nr:carboxylate-amine ligase [Paracoccaceae bacterium]
RWRLYDNFLLNENRWRAQRYGVGNGLIDFGHRKIVPMGKLVNEMIELLEPDAAKLGCLAEIERAREIVTGGNSADRQRAVYISALEAGKTKDDALREIVRHLIQEYHVDL